MKFCWRRDWVVDLSKTYNPEPIETKWTLRWEKDKTFVANNSSLKPFYVILIPLPNVTGILHLGHVLNMTTQDMLIRAHKMQGYEVMWLPGTDHAGIATQNKVEEKLAEEGLTRFDIGRVEFVKRVWAWKDQYHDRIIKQMKRFGLGCDWSRETFTMDENYARAVHEVFVRLYEKGYIYRDEYIVNYCPRCETVISNEEVEAEEKEGKLYYISYPLKGGGALTVATTRPETMLGDTAVAVHPDDERYKEFVGKKVVLPLMNRKIPVISDERVDPKFGTGVVKITPAHDPDDFKIGREHDLGIINILDEKGHINENGGKYKGLERFEARKRILEELKEKGLFKKEEPHQHYIGHCSRCHTVIEPYISKQWFVKMDDMAKKAKKVVEEGEVKFYLPRWTKVYYHWIDNIRPWVISRQLWWGHRIPVYYCKECNEVIVSATKVTKCTKCGSVNIVQEEDVLDTWFSSWLWPFVPFGWPEETKDLKAFFPSSTLVSGWDIIFLWVARMIMSSLEFMEDIPFKEVYLHGMIRDEKRRPLSKSLGNSPDPLDLIAKYGADALRIGILRITPEGKDVIYKEESIQNGRNFLNKIWNASRFILMNCKEGDRSNIEGVNLYKVDRWIISKVMGLIKETEDLIDSFRINEASRLLVFRFWHEFCDWYLEMLKPRIYNEDESDRKGAISVALWAFKQYLKLLHPYIPFITEEINEIMPGTEGELIESNWPVYEEFYREQELEREMELLMNFVSNVRNIRAEFNLPHDKEIELVVDGDPNFFELLNEELSWISILCSIKRIKRGKRVSHAAFFHQNGINVYIPLEGIIDFEKERERLSKEIQDIEGILKDLIKQLSNEQFLKKAPEKVVKESKEKKERFQEKLNRLLENLKRIS
ncbi:valine--tRNA ligase [candidate division WOR-3 bacterium]|nr:valine--tRNA ligase [candidate division WOR-3 bacterium]